MIVQFFTELREELKFLLYFLKNPHQNFDRKYSFFEKQKTVTALFLIEIVFTFLVALPINYIVGKVYHLRNTDDLSIYSIIEIILLGVLLVPFIEEIIFRLPLKFKRNYFFRFLDLFSSKKLFKQFWFSNYRFFYYFFAICFGLLHISNYDNKITPTFILVSFFITISQLSGGLIMGYLRVKFSFIWGFSYHAIWNFVFMIGYYLIYNNNILIDYKTNNTQIKLVQLIATSDKPYIFKNIENDSIYEMKIINADLQYLLNEVAPDYHSDEIKVVNLEINSKKGIHRNEVFKILNNKIQIDSINN